MGNLNILRDLGYDAQLDTFIQMHGLADFEIGRIIRESKKKYMVKTQAGNYQGQISGKLRHEVKSRSDYPASQKPHQHWLQWFVSYRICQWLDVQ